MGPVYVVDPDAAIRDALVTLVESFDLPVRAFADAESFLQEVGHEQGGFVLIEAEMPGINGLGLLRRLRDNGNTMPVILLTADADSEIAEYARRAGAAAVLRKPFVGDDAWTPLD